MLSDFLFWKLKLLVLCPSIYFYDKKIRKQVHITNYWYFKQKRTFDADCIANTTLNKRILEHRNNKNETVVVHVHKSTYKHDFDFDSVKIKDIENDYQKRHLRNVIY